MKSVTKGKKVKKIQLNISSDRPRYRWDFYSYKSIFNNDGFVARFFFFNNQNEFLHHKQFAESQRITIHQDDKSIFFISEFKYIEGYFLVK